MGASAIPAAVLLGAAAPDSPLLPVVAAIMAPRGVEPARLGDGGPTALEAFMKPGPDRDMWILLWSLVYVLFVLDLRFA